MLVFPYRCKCSVQVLGAFRRVYGQSKAAIGSPAANAHFFRTADLGAECSEGPVSALNVKMCMAQHLSLSAHCGPWGNAQRMSAMKVEAKTFNNHLGFERGLWQR
jgi:hypothetical protein